jgi:hypothetical protein
MYLRRKLACVVPGLIALAGCANPTARLEPSIPPTYLDAQQLPDQWRTRAERTDHEETGRYDEAVDFCRRLAAASPHAHFTSFGISGEGRALPLLILSKDRAFTPSAAAQSGKLLVLVQNCIHAGECEGKDASLALARDILITGTRARLLDQVNLLIMPIFNADGHERFGPASRINQNGPREMGWRVNAVNLNLNRDYTKADAVEMCAWLRCWNSWQPDFFFDNHTTDGGDCQYDIFYSTSLEADAGPSLQTWTRETFLPAVLSRLAADGHLALPLSDPRDPNDLTRGIEATSPYLPRLSTGYVSICNRPTILVETHSLKPYGQRVRATYDVMVHTLEELNREPSALRAAVRAADEQCIQTRGAGPDGRAALWLTPSDEYEPLTYHAIEQRLRRSEITGTDVIEYTGRPVEVETRLFDRLRPAKTIVPPAAYLIPPQWTEVIRRLELHGVEFFRLQLPERLEVELYELQDAKFPGRPHEGRQLPTYRAVAKRKTRDFPAGTVVVPLSQRRAKLVVHLLEPEAPDSLAAWGFFNAILERKEYAETYMLEPVAQRMLADDPALKREFEEKLAADPAFASNPDARLDFFYRRSPYWDTAYGVYPVARLTDAAVLGRP